MGTRRSDSLYFRCGGHGSAEYLLGFWWIWLGFGCAAVLGQHGLDTGLPQGWMNYTIFSAFSMGNCFEAKPSAAPCGDDGVDITAGAASRRR